MITVLLYGHLAKKFGKRHEYDIRTPRDAIAALRANYKDFAATVVGEKIPGYRVIVDSEARDIDGLKHPAQKTIKIVPVVSGAGRGVGQAIAGIALIVASFYLPGAWAVFARSVGTSLTLGGVSQMLTKPPESPGTPETADRKQSYGFDGAVNTTAQGNPVPLCYGKMIVGSQVISAGLEAVDI
jgi:predicted phage tail protein